MEKKMKERLEIIKARWKHVAAARDASNELSRSNNFDLEHFDNAFSHINQVSNKPEDMNSEATKLALSAFKLDTINLINKHLGTDDNNVCRVAAYMMNRITQLHDDKHLARQFAMVIASDFAKANATPFNWDAYFHKDKEAYANLMKAFEAGENGNQQTLQKVLEKTVLKSKDPDIALEAKRLSIYFNDISSNIPSSVDPAYKGKESPPENTSSSPSLSM
jgi:hypothetical protein